MRLARALLDFVVVGRAGRLFVVGVRGQLRTAVVEEEPAAANARGQLVVQLVQLSDVLPVFGVDHGKASGGSPGNPA